MKVPNELRIPLTVFALQAGMLICLGLIFLVLAPP